MLVAAIGTPASAATAVTACFIAVKCTLSGSGWSNANHWCERNMNTSLPRRIACFTLLIEPNLIESSPEHDITPELRAEDSEDSEAREAKIPKAR